ncbi:MAG: hypothetical protein GX633_01100, partial [Clostridiales bacterium]|nr:hypothetical protein [Clostridiales bacterium]
MCEKLLCGVSREDITPPVGGRLFGYRDNVFSESVHDNLNVTAFAFSQGNTKAMMISATVCSVSIAVDEEIRQKISDETGIPFGNIILGATHTHSGPNTSGGVGWGDIDREYCDSIFIPRIYKAATDAFKSLVPVKMGFAIGNSLVGINRRQLGVNNEAGLGQRPWGPFNPKMTVVTFKSDEGNTVGNMIFYGCHGTSAGMNHEISRDWSGIMCDSVENVSGGLTGFFVGPEGDVGPRLTNGRTTGNISYTEELGGLAASDAVRIYRQIVGVSDIVLSCACTELRIPLQNRISREEAKKLYDETEGETVNIKGRYNNYARNVLSSYDEGYVNKEYIPHMQTAIRLGNIVFISFGYELFSEVGMRINEYATNCEVISLALANGSAGYFVT